ncbi:transcriptional regulator [Burkholderia sp. Nafp2/4-1b]|uniref:winged helix-turn-helix domain-containing protein n=1 Tax=Burkholderia sp. Nafp2/4-1b TaxID=2116686 RepID=UPI000EF95E04|nr:winged helix-turn-helix domain-containing protein [Burkholderia sp. Nafp2/4-1b]RKT98673.1 transcriptional regulator [Burkholderia sp. Nafp2/4-1b]
MKGRYVCIDNIKINFVYRTIEIDGRSVGITSREFDIFEFLLDNMNKVVSRWAIQRAVWGREFDASSRTLETHISRIRSKLRLDEDKNMRILPAYAMGYRLVLFGAAMVTVAPEDVVPATRSLSEHTIAGIAAADRTVPAPWVSI